MGIQESKDYIIGVDSDGVIHKTKRASDKQLAYISSLERQLGYTQKNHNQMPVYKAARYITKLKNRLLERDKQQELF